MKIRTNNITNPKEGKVLQVPIDKIMPVTSARAKISSLVNDVQQKNTMYVLTRGGKPAAILTSIDNFQGSQPKENTQNKTEQPVKKVENNIKKAQKRVEENVQNIQKNTVSEEQPVKISIN